MSARTVKVAISLPLEEFKEVENLRKQLSISRSAVFVKALHQWIKALKTAEQDRRYAEGYRKYPETEEEHIPLSMVAEALADSPWEP